MTDQIVTTLDLLRHGEPVGGRKYRGQIDDPLSDTGWAQMRAAVGGRHPWDRIITSPLQRCRAFAEELGKRHGIPIEPDARLREIGFGEWEGRTAAELLAGDPECLPRFLRDPLGHAPRGAESLFEFESRILAAWNEILRSYSGQHLLVVGHAGMMRMIIRHVLDMPLDRLFRLQIGNAALIRVRIEGQGEQALPRLLLPAGRL